jgi:hypothetical protein
VKTEAITNFFSRVSEAVQSIVQQPEFTEQVVKGSPAVAAAAWTMNDWVVLLTGIYVALQTAYLVRKWWREEAKK